MILEGEERGRLKSVLPRIKVSLGDWGKVRRNYEW